MRQLIQHEGHKIAVYEAGQGEAVIFLHGWPTNALLWQPQVEALQKQYRVLTLDWLGFGHSDKPTDYAYTFTHQKEVLNTVLQTVLDPEEPITLVGHDIGGPPAILWAQDHPSRVRKLVLLNTVLYTFSTPLDKRSHTLFKIPLLKQLLGSSFGLRQIMHSVSQSKPSAIGKHIRDILAAHQNLSSNLAIRLILDPIQHGKQAELLSLATTFQQLEVSKHLIVATEDPLCGAHIERLHQENLTVPVDYLKGCGHYVAVDAAAELTTVLGRVLVSSN
jgi:pimeloyl-ACP methyl ester carboxylesterase